MTQAHRDAGLRQLGPVHAHTRANMPPWRWGGKSAIARTFAQAKANATTRRKRGRAILAQVSITQVPHAAKEK